MDWLGAWGGLLDGLYYIIDFFVGPYSTYMLKSKLALFLVRFLPSESANHKQEQERKLSKKEAFDSKYGDSADDPKRRNIL